MSEKGVGLLTVANVRRRGRVHEVLSTVQLYAVDIGVTATVHLIHQSEGKGTRPARMQESCRYTSGGAKKIHLAKSVSEFRPPRLAAMRVRSSSQHSVWLLCGG